MAKCKITMLKRTLHEDLVAAYKSKESIEQTGAGLCPLFEEGQEFIVDSPWTAPESFCLWAWADFRQFVLSFFLGNDEPPSNPSDVLIACCTDGFRPVIFKLERAE
jgi:uncharacterized repeat protein (TIGR04076 family)